MTTKRPVGRPPSGLPKRVRKNLNIQRDVEFDKYLSLICHTKGIDQTAAVKLAVKFFVEQRSYSCPHCNGVGYVAIQDGDDDLPCPECAEAVDTPI